MSTPESATARAEQNGHGEHQFWPGHSLDDNYFDKLEQWEDNEAANAQAEGMP